MVQVHRGDRVDRVDQAHRIRTPLQRRLGGLSNIGDVRRQLHDHRHPRVRLGPARHHLDILGHLPHGAAHAAFAHPVRAAKVQLDPVRARVLDLLEDKLPRVLLAGHHQADDHGPVRIVSLDLLDLGQVHVQRPVRDQLDVVQAQQSPIRPPDRSVPRAVHVDDMRIQAQRLPHHTAPTRLKGPAHVIRLVRRRRRGQPERVRALDPDKVARQISHLALASSLFKYGPRRADLPQAPSAR